MEIAVEMKTIRAFRARLRLLLFCSVCLCVTAVAGTPGNGDEPPEPPQSSPDWVSYASRLGAKIIDLRGKEKTPPPVPRQPLKTKDDLLRFLKDAPLNSAIVFEKAGGLKIYLLPTGVQSDLLTRARKIATDSQAFAAVDAIGPLTPATGTVLEQPEVRALKGLSELEKGLDIHYQRFVNPADLSSSYSFKLRYDSRFGSLVPYARNGEAVTGRMEGFTSFSSVYAFIESNADHFVAQRSGPNLYLRLEGDQESIMRLKGNIRQIEITTRAHPKAGPILDFQLVGNEGSAHSIAKITHDTGVLTLVDFVEGR